MSNIFVLAVLYINNQTIVLLKRSSNHMFAPSLYSLVEDKVEIGDTARFV